MKHERLENMVKGWFVGAFSPTVLHTTDCEIAIKHYAKGDTETCHFHKIATEITVVLTGVVRMFDREWTAGDILTILPGEVTDFLALTDAVTVVVKHPGALKDKYSVGVSTQSQQAAFFADPSTRLFDAQHDFRMPSTQHGIYTTVSLINYDLGQIKQWPLILDEALRLMQRGKPSLFQVRFSQHHFMSVFAFAAFLRRRKDFSFQPLDQVQDPDGTLHYQIACTREATQPHLDSFEFALITDGKRLDKVIRFIESVLNIRGFQDIEGSIAICGPVTLQEKLKAYMAHIRWIEEPVQYTAKGWITRKKNLIVESSRAENLLIAHDRYEISETFLEAMRDFGADFSVIVPAQIDQDGQRFPDWVISNNPWLCTQSGLLQYGDYHPNLYVNGGVIISKRKVLMDTPWNDLLFWNQAEDIELTRCMTEQGVTPRLARSVILIANDMRPGYKYDLFARLPFMTHAYVLPHGSIDPAQISVGVFSEGTILHLGNQTLIQLAKQGVVLSHTDWKNEPTGLIPVRKLAELAMDLGEKQERSLFLDITLSSSVADPILQVQANGNLLTYKRVENHFSFDLSPCLAEKTRFIVFSFSAQTAICLKTLALSRDETALHYPFDFRRQTKNTLSILMDGWSVPEHWGVWSVEKTASIRLPALQQSASGMQLILRLKAFAPSNERFQWVGIACNGMPVACLKLSTKRRSQKCKVLLPRVWVTQRSCQITFMPASPSSPSEHGLSSDLRKLAIGLIKVDAKPL